MADFQIPDKTQETNIDRAADSLLVYDNSATALRRATVNNLLDLTSHPVGINDTQTLTNKTITAPTVSDPVLSGTVTGTYTLGGTPTFPSAVVTLTGSQTLTNKVLTSPTINTATIANPTLTTDTVSEYTGAAGVTIDGVLIKDSKMNGSYITDSTIGNSQVIAGMPVQMAYSVYSAVNSGTTTVPSDDTIPQNSEGTEFMTLAITPKSATNILVIEAIAYLSNSFAGAYDMIGAIFQDTTADALAAGIFRGPATTTQDMLVVRHIMVAGTTSSTTFKFRAGSNSAGTTTFNGTAGARRLGTTNKSSMVIWEYKAS